MERKENIIEAKPEEATGNTPPSGEATLPISRKTEFPRFHCCRGKFRLFGHYVHAQFLLLALVEFLALASVTYLSLEYLYPLLSGHATSVVWKEILLASVALVFGITAMGLYDARQRERFYGIAFRLAGAFIFTSAVLWIFYHIYPHYSWDKLQYLMFSATALVVLTLIRVVFYRYVDSRILLRRTLVLGTGKRASHIDRLRRKSDKRGFKLVGFVAHKSCQPIHVDTDRIINTGMNFCPFALTNNVDEIVIALDDRRQKLPIDELLDCRMSGVDVIDAIDFFERERALIHLDLLQPGWLIHAEGFKRNAFRAITKRTFDLLVSAVLLVLSSPLSLFTALAILVESRGKGPIFYFQERTGLNGVPFKVIKFRSMRTDAEADGKARWAVEGDPRVTRVGAVIRKYRLDEIPQLWNILRGDMSLVGPRPERPEFVERLTRINPLYWERHRVKPGLTGWAQLSYPYGSSDEDSMQKLQYDLYYIKNRTLFFDFYILVQTVEVVLFRKGSR